MLNSFTDKITINHKQEKRWANFFQNYPNAISFNASLSFCLFLLCCSNAYCNVSFYFLGILGVMKSYNFAWQRSLKLVLPGHEACHCFPLTPITNKLQGIAQT